MCLEGSMETPAVFSVEIHKKACVRHDQWPSSKDVFVATPQRACSPTRTQYASAVYRASQPRSTIRQSEGPEGIGDSEAWSGDELDCGSRGLLADRALYAEPQLAFREMKKSSSHFLAGRRRLQAIHFTGKGELDRTPTPTNHHPPPLLPPP
ncbi:hypothetical protein SKAU_G00003660 [Synaphobranchus kaupii]|uniref:Uncharacterized protein n=1 Tax=Synaphobranchus kaupii TaxID=118154 RepID=A0A9Q1JBG9_SYNKA|nr:hypothetical protein SKAU_G00003660 [Synaphobranchus kaupii]